MLDQLCETGEYEELRLVAVPTIEPAPCQASTGAASP
jgi:hypothetical protein